MRASYRTLVVFLLLLELPIGVPAFVVGRRRLVSYAWVAFIPLVGPGIVVLRSIGSRPLVDAYYARADREHLLWSVGRFHDSESALTQHRLGDLVIIPLLNFVGFWVYAFTLADQRRLVPATAIA